VVILFHHLENKDKCIEIAKLITTQKVIQ